MSFGKHLKRVMESNGPAQTLRAFGDALAEKKIDPYGLNLPRFVRDFLGHDMEDNFRKLRAVNLGQAHTLEATEAQDASAFSNITGQLLVTIIKEKYESPEFVASKLVKTYPNPGGNLKEHKVPYLSDVLEKPEVLSQLEPYPQTRFAESWVTMPAPEKRGQICALSMEMLYSDLTGQAQDSAASIGRALAYQKEERVLRVVLGLDNPYVFNGTAYNTYVSTAGTPGYVNKKLSNTVVNYTQINDVEQLFWAMVDPITGRRIYARPTAILCAPQKRYEVKRVLGATETRSGDITTGDGNQVIAPNPLDVTYPVISSAIAQALLAATALNASQQKEYMVFADFQKAFGYREVYPLRTDTAPALNQMEFTQDVVLAVKCSEFGVPFVYDPHYAVLSTSESS